MAGPVSLVQGNIPRRVSKTILTSTPSLRLTVPQPFQDVPCSPASQSASKQKRTRREVETGWRVHKPSVHTPQPQSLSPRQAPRPHPRKAPAPTIWTRLHLRCWASASPRPLFPGHSFLNCLLRFPKTRTTLPGRPPCFADKEALPGPPAAPLPNPARSKLQGLTSELWTPFPRPTTRSRCSHPSTALPLSPLWGLQ